MTVICCHTSRSRRRRSSCSWALPIVFFKVEQTTNTRSRAQGLLTWHKAWHGRHSPYACAWSFLPWPPPSVRHRRHCTCNGRPLVTHESFMEWFTHSSKIKGKGIDHIYGCFRLAMRTRWLCWLAVQVPLHVIHNNNNPSTPRRRRAMMLEQWKKEDSWYEEDTMNQMIREVRCARGHLNHCLITHTHSPLLLPATKPTCCVPTWKLYLCHFHVLP